MTINLRNRMQKSPPIGINTHDDDYETTPLLSLRQNTVQKHRVRRALTVSTQKMPEKIRRGHHFSFKKGDLVEKVHSNFAFLNLRYNFKHLKNGLLLWG